MTTDDLEQVLSEAFAGVFGRPIDLSMDVSRESWSEWDSLKHVELVFAIEAACALELDEATIASINSVDDLRQVLSARLAA